MRFLFATLIFVIALLPCTASARDEMCAPLKSFVESIKPDQTKSIEFHTIWGGQFKDSPKPDSGFVMYEKRCAHHDYGPAKAICLFLAENGATEFSGENAKRVLSCLSPATKFGQMQLEVGEFSFSYGNKDRGSNIEVKFKEDIEIGGMVLSISASGY